MKLCRTKSRNYHRSPSRSRTSTPQPHAKSSSNRRHSSKPEKNTTHSPKKWKTYSTATNLMSISGHSSRSWGKSLGSAIRSWKVWGKRRSDWSLNCNPSRDNIPKPSTIYNTNTRRLCNSCSLPIAISRRSSKYWRWNSCRKAYAMNRNYLSLKPWPIYCRSSSIRVQSKLIGVNPSLVKISWRSWLFSSKNWYKNMTKLKSWPKIWNCFKDSFR